ncbi:MAG: hypothetical protein AAF570_27480, partial [Bacteroidota bacterium]
GEPVHTVCDEPSLDMEPMRVVLGVHSHPVNERDPNDNIPPIIDFNSSMTFPQYMRVQYFRFYEMNEALCGTNTFVPDQNALNSFVPGVRKNIWVGWQNPIVTAPNSVTTFRASNEIILNFNFEVPLGAELNLIPTVCN